MQVWTGSSPAPMWQEFDTLAWLPWEPRDRVYARFRDEFGNASDNYSDTTYPVFSPPPERQFPFPPTGMAIDGPSTGLIETSYSFTSTVSPITATLPITYVWQANQQSPLTNTGALSDSVTFTWQATGTQAITVTASNVGGTATGAHAITIYSPVQAAFTAVPTGGFAPLTVVFTNTSSGDYTASLWSFGDSITSTMENPTHTYTAAGVFTVSLEISGPGGSDKETKAGYVTVEEYTLYLPLMLREP